MFIIFFFKFEFINEYSLKKFMKMFLIGCDIYFKERDMLIMKINLWNIGLYLVYKIVYEKYFYIVISRFYYYWLEWVELWFMLKDMMWFKFFCF